MVIIFQITSFERNFFHDTSHVSRLTSLLAFCLLLSSLNACRTQNNSGLEDAGVVGPNGEVALFFRDKADIVIWQCEDYTVLKTREDCKIKSGTKEARVLATDFKKHLLSIIHMSDGYGYPGFKEQIELSKTIEAAKQEDLARQKAQLSAEVDKIEAFIKAYGVENTDAVRTASLKKQLSDVEAQFKKNPNITNAVKSINTLIDKLVDETISKPGIITLTSKDAFAFNVLKTYLSGRSVSTEMGELIRIPAGSFMMGRPDSETPDSETPEDEMHRYFYEGPQHKVTISKDFFMGATEVTQGQWFKVMGDNPSSFKKQKYCPKEHLVISGTPLCPNYPVENVSWNDVQVFLSKLNKDGGGYRLPTEAEWEYAARARTTTPFNLGENIDPTKVNYHGERPYKNAATGLYRGQTVAVGSLKNANGWGLYDMHGNVEEWTQDWSGKYSSSAATDPKGPSSGAYRVLRGGGWRSGARSTRSASRVNGTPGDRYSDVGFRLVRTIP